MSEPDTTDTLERLARVAAMIGKLAKDKTNKHSNYSYLSEEAIKTAINHHLPEGGAWHDSVRFEIVSDEWVKGKQGDENLIKVRATVTFGEHAYEGLGAGIDYRDKALMKAQTAAIREAWKNVFVIAGGGDPEADSERDGDRVNSGRAQEGPRDAPRRSGTSGTINFGKYKGRKWADVPGNYLEWLLSKSDKPGIISAAQSEMERRRTSTTADSGDDGPPPPDDDDIPY